MLILTMAISLHTLSPAVRGKTKKKPPLKEPQDTIEVVGHIPLTNGAVTGFLPTRHRNSYYLYAEHDGVKDVTLIDITKANQPVVLADVAHLSSAGVSASLFAAAGTAVLITEEQGAITRAPAIQTIRLVDCSDPQHPRIDREFAGVTAISTDDRRGLIFLANPEGIWILHQRLAEDPEVEKEYARHVLYDH